MSRPELAFLIPARRLTVSGDPASAADTAVSRLLGEGLTVKSRVGATVVLEYGTPVTGLLGGLGLGILPGSIGKHGYAVVETAPDGDATTLTIAHVGGRHVNVPVRAAIEGTIADLRAAGTLLDEGSPISAHDLPADSSGNPATFARAGYVSGSERWLTS